MTLLCFDAHRDICMSTVEECRNIVPRNIVHLIGHAIRIRISTFFCKVDSKSLSERKRDDEEGKGWLESGKEMPGEEGYGESWTTVRKGKNVEKLGSSLPRERGKVLAIARTI